MQYLICLQLKCQTVIVVWQSSIRKIHLPDSFLGTQAWESIRGQHEGHHKIIPASVRPDTPIGWRRMNNKSLHYPQQWNGNMSLNVWNIEQEMVNCVTIFLLGGFWWRCELHRQHHNSQYAYLFFVLHNSRVQQHPSYRTFAFSSLWLEDRTNKCKSMFFFGLFQFSCSSFVMKSNSLTFWQLTLYSYGHKSTDKKKIFHSLSAKVVSRINKCMTVDS